MAGGPITSRVERMNLNRDDIDRDTDGDTVV
jgi:hypothetical protein